MSTVPSTRSRDDLAARFAAQRPRLRGIASRMLGSPWNADDAVQETWLRLQRSDIDSIENLEAWLTTVVSRVCVDQLRQSAAQREDLDAALPDDSDPAPTDPEPAALRADDVSVALHVVLDTLGPLERLAFVLHDVFGLAFDDIAPIIERTSANARQLASRARRRLREVDVRAARTQQREAVDAFRAAARDGDFGRLLQLLDPEVELRSDDTGVALATANAEHGAPLLQARLRGADAVARVFAGRAQLAEVALVDGLPAAIYAPGGAPHAAYLVHIAGGRISRIDIIGDPEHLRDLAVTPG